MLMISGYIVMLQAQYFLQDLKLGHYLKVPPRPMFFAQSSNRVFLHPTSCVQPNSSSSRSSMGRNSANSSHELGIREHQRVPLPPSIHIPVPKLTAFSVCTSEQPDSYTCPGGQVF